MPDIVITEFMDEGAVARIRARFDTLYDPSLVDDARMLVSKIADARAIIVRNRTQLRGNLLDAATKLECVGRLGVGLDNIDVEACRARAIEVYPATGANDLAVAEYVMAMALSLLRGAYASTSAVASGAWPRRQASVGRELSGTTIGLVGYGAIAREVAWRAHSYGMKIAAFDPYLDIVNPAWQMARNLPLEELLQCADIVSLHVPLTDSTRHMIGAAALRTMKSGAILINAARGGVVDESALAAALKAKSLGGAALDVFETEPLTAEAGAKFAGLSNLILTPHIAGVTKESNVRVSDMIAETIIGHFEKAA